MILIMYIYKNEDEAATDHNRSRGAGGVWGVKVGKS